MPGRRRIHRDVAAVSPVIATILMVAITVVLAVALYFIVASLAMGPSGPQLLELVVQRVDGNWSVVITSVPGSKLPNTTYILIRDQNQNILLSRTPFSNLTSANWGTNFVLYEDAWPSVQEISPPDRLLIDRTRYPVGSVVEVSDKMRILAIQELD